MADKLVSSAVFQYRREQRHLAHLAGHDGIPQRRRREHHFERSTHLPDVPKPTPVIVHQYLPTFPPILPGSIALSFFAHVPLAPTGPQ